MKDQTGNPEAPQTQAPTVGYWSKQRAATYLDCPTWTIDYLCRTGRLPFYLMANKRRFTRADLDAYAASCRVGGVEPTDQQSFAGGVQA